MKNMAASVESFKMKWETFLCGCDALEELERWDKEALGEMDVYYLNELLGVILRLIAADGRVTVAETEYLEKTFGFESTPEELRLVYENCQDDLEKVFDENFENGISYMRKISTKLADAYKELLWLSCGIIIKSDRVVSDEEVEEVERLRKLCE